MSIFVDKNSTARANGRQYYFIVTSSRRNASVPNEDFLLVFLPIFSSLSFSLSPNLFVSLLRAASLISWCSWQWTTIGRQQTREQRRWPLQQSPFLMAAIYIRPNKSWNNHTGGTFLFHRIRVTYMRVLVARIRLRIASWFVDHRRICIIRYVRCDSKPIKLVKHC